METTWPEDDRDALVREFLQVTEELADLPAKAKELGARRALLAVGLARAYGTAYEAAKHVDQTTGNFMALMNRST